MSYPITIYDGKGNIKQEISAQDADRLYWSEFSNLTEQVYAPGAIVTVGQIVRKKRVMKCLHCKKDFLGNSRAKFCPYTALTSAEDNCKQSFYREKAGIKRGNREPVECKMCKKMFICGTGNIRKYCHAPCTSAIMIKSKQPAPRDYACVSCGEMFKSVKRRSFAKYCHNPCNPKNTEKRRDEAKERRRIAKVVPCKEIVIVEKKCSLCEEPFKTHKKNRIYCWNPCPADSSAEGNRVSVSCKMCKEIFLASRNGRIYCNLPCNYESHQAQIKRDLRP